MSLERRISNLLTDLGSASGSDHVFVCTDAGRLVAGEGGALKDHLSATGVLQRVGRDLERTGKSEVTLLEPIHGRVILRRVAGAAGERLFLVAAPRSITSWPTSSHAAIESLSGLLAQGDALAGGPLDGLFSEDDVSFLVGSGVITDDAGAPENDHPLRALTRNIASQYVEPIAGLATGVFAGRGRELRPQFAAAVGALRRLAEASDDREMVAVLADFEAMVPEHELRGRARDRLYHQLREWVGRFSDLLPAADRDRMRAVIDPGHGESPFIQELLRVEGIGEKRMERLYCAGLFTVTAVVGATAGEIAAVTGMPLRLAERVVSTARKYEQERPRRVASSLLQFATQTRETLEAVRPDDPRRDEIVSAARAAVDQLLAVLTAMESAQGTRSDR